MGDGTNGSPTHKLCTCDLINIGGIHFFLLINISYNGRLNESENNMNLITKKTENNLQSLETLDDYRILLDPNEY